MASKFAGCSCVIRQPEASPAIFENLSGGIFLPYMSNDDDTETISDLVIINMSPRDLGEHAAWLLKIATALAEGKNVRDIPPPGEAIKAMERSRLALPDFVPPGKAQQAYRRLPVIDGKRKFR